MKKGKKSRATKKQGKPVMRHWLTNKLRRLSYQWPPRREAITRARTERGVYTCNICRGSFGPKEIQLDHIHPVVDEEAGFIDWNTYIDRLFCDVDGFQVLCKTCHDAKTFLEKEIRKQVKHDKRKNEDDDI